MRLLIVGVLAAASCGAAATRPAAYDITAFGAAADGKSLCTAAIQRAIDQCTSDGGGTVVVPPGTFLTGTINLKSNVTLHLPRGSTLLGSATRENYPPIPLRSVTTPAGDNPADFAIRARTSGGLALVAGNEVENVSITGEGTIDGNGHSATFLHGDNAPGRPKILLFQRCRNVSVSGITLKNSASWVQHYLGCDNVHVGGLTVYSHANWNNDGLDIESTNVAVSDCLIDSDDDAICFKSGRGYPCENVTVSNCVVGSNCNAIKMGTASAGSFKNITINNCVVRGASEDNFRKWNSVISGIALEVVDGGEMDQVAISNIAMTRVQTPIFIKLGNRMQGGADKGRAGTLRNVTIGNVVATNDSLMSSSITGFPGHYVENVTIHDVTLTGPGGGTSEQAAASIKENEKAYPENRMFGKFLPAYGLYARHVRGLTMRNVELKLAQADRRPAVVMEDVHELDASGIRAAVPEDVNAPVLRLINCTDALIHSNMAREGVKVWLRVEGAQTAGIKLAGNDLGRAQVPIQLGEGVSPDAARIGSGDGARH